MKIKSGTGNGFEAHVDAENRLSAAAVTSTESEHNADKGNKYIVSTGDITLSSAANTSVIYIKNDSVLPLFITNIEYSLGASASGSGDAVMSVIRNPTVGDIITNANNVSILQNQNHGSTNTFIGLTYKGASGETLISNGDESWSLRLADHTSSEMRPIGTMILARGSSIAVNYTPPASNTSQIVQFALHCFYQDIVV